MVFGFSQSGKIGVVFVVCATLPAFRFFVSASGTDSVDVNAGLAVGFFGSEGNAGRNADKSADNRDRDSGVDGFFLISRELSFYRR